MRLATTPTTPTCPKTQPNLALPRNIPLQHEPPILKENNYQQRQVLETKVITTEPKCLSSYPSNTGGPHGTPGEKLRYVDTIVSTGTSLRNVGTSQGVPGLKKQARVGKSSDNVNHHHHPAESRQIQPDLMTTAITSRKSEIQGNVDAHFSEPKRVNNSVSELANIFGTKITSRRSSGRQPGENTGKEETFGRQPQEEDNRRQQVNVFITTE